MDKPNSVTVGTRDLVVNYLEKNPGHGRDKLAAYLGISRDKARRLIDKHRRKGSSIRPNASIAAANSGIRQTLDDKTWRISADQVRIDTIEKLLEHFKVDTRIWRVKKFECTSYEQAQAPRPLGSSEDGWTVTDTRAIIVPLYNVRAEFERIPENEAMVGIVESLKADILKLGTSKKIVNSTYKPTSNGRCLEINIPDVHFGKLAWAPETGWENYDLHIAEKIWTLALEDQLSRAGGDIEQIWFVVGNDLIHFDNRQWATTRGTLQDGDSRYQKVFSRVQSIMLNSVEKMLSLAPVKIKGVVGNHDTHASWHLTNSLEMAFRGWKYVEVDNLPTVRKYDQFGKNMIMWYHGDDIKPVQYPALMARERPQMFCSSRFHEAHIGHWHVTRNSDFRVDEANGVIVRVLPSLSPADAWHSGKGYVGNVRSTDSYIYDKDNGLVTVNHWNVPEGL